MTGIEQERDFNPRGDHIFGQRLAQQEVRGRAEPCVSQDGDEGHGEKIIKYNMEQLGNIPLEREDGTMRVLVSQMGGCSSTETRDIKIAATEHLIRKYDINFCAFVELNFNWMKVNSSANLASWFHEKERKLRLVTAHNTTEFNDIFGKHQLGGTGMVCRHKFIQYARKPSVDPRGLGRWCSWPFY